MDIAATRSPFFNFIEGFAPNRRKFSTSRTCPRAAVAASKADTRSRIFILGMGNVAQFLASELKNDGWVISGTCRSAVKKKKLEECGCSVYLFDSKETEFNVIDAMRCHSHLLVSVPPVQGLGDPVLLHREILGNKLKDGDLQWICYFSSTSVYGNCGGALVDENYSIEPASEQSKMRLAAEKGWVALGTELSVPTYVFRLGGIYGPGRSVIDSLITKAPLSAKQGERMYKKYTSRVHVADICQAVKAGMMSATGGVFNIVDDEPSPRSEVFEFARQLIESKWPTLVLRGPDNHVVDSLDEGGKRVCNARMKRELGVKLLYPDYRSGLESIIDLMEVVTSFEREGVM